ncbi:MAG: thioredoxin family protein [Phyllobacterium sp.]
MEDACTKPECMLKRSTPREVDRRSFLFGISGAAAFAALFPVDAAAAATPMVRSVETYREALSLLAPRYRYALIDIRADWCPACLRMEREVFPHPSVRQLLEHVALIKVDVTAMDDANRRLLSHLRADGPPTLFVIDIASGGEYEQTRTVGSLRRRDLIRRLQPFARG